MHRARYIDLLAIDRKPLEQVNVQELKKAILVTASAERNWLREKAKARRVSTIDFTKAIRTDICLEQSAYITKFTSRHLLLPMEDGSLIGWDMKQNAQSGSYKMDRECILVDLALDKSTRTLVGLVGKVSPIR